MKTMLNLKEIASYQTEGMVIPAFRLDDDYVQHARDKTASFLADNPQLDANYIPSLIERDRSWLELACDPGLLDCVSQIIGDDVILWGSALFCKTAAGGKATPWHQDGHYWPIRPLATCTVWIAFDHSTAENGCMRYVPGSHLARELLPHDTDDNQAFTLNQVVSDIASADAKGRDIVLEPGQFSIHDVYLIHGSQANNSHKRRGGLVLRFMPASSHFDRDLARRQVAEMGVVDISERELHLLRGHDRSGKNDVFKAA